MRERSTRKYFLAIALFAMFSPTLLLAQRHDESIRVRSKGSEDAHGTKIGEHIPITGGENIEEELKSNEPKADSEKKAVVAQKKPTKKPVRKTPAAAEHYAFLGVQYDMAFTPVLGSHITRVLENTPAKRAGLRPEDVITTVDGVRLREMDDLARIIGTKKAGEKVSLTFVRDGIPRKVQVTLGKYELGDAETYPRIRRIVPGDRSGSM